MSVQNGTYQSVLMESIFGDKKPKVPAAPHVSGSEATNEALDINKSSLPKIEDIAGKINDFSSDQLLKQINKMLPGYSDTLDKEGTQIKSLLSGELPQDVQDLLGRKAAELGITTGSGGSNFSKFGQLRDLGMTSLQAIQQGFDAASRWIASAAKPQMFDFSSMLVTPQQMIGLEQWNEQERWGPQWLQAQLDAQPPGWAKGLDTVLNWAETSAASYANMSTGTSAGSSNSGKGKSMMNNDGGGGWNEQDYNQSTDEMFSQFGTG